MANNYFTGQGLVLRRGQTVPAPALLATEVSFTQVAYIKGLTPPGRKKKTVEFNVLDVAGALTASGGREPAEVQFSIAFDASEAQHLGLYADADLSTALSRRVYEIAFPNVEASTMRFFGECVSWEWDEFTPEGVCSANVVMKLNGAEVFTV